MSHLAPLVRSANTVLFTWSHCPFCVKAKALLTPMTTNIKIYDLQAIDNGDAVHAEIKKSTGHETVPAVYIGGDLVGGFSEVAKLQAEGKLEAMLKK